MTKKTIKILDKFVRDKKRTEARRRKKLAALNPTVRDLIGEWIPRKLPSDNRQWFFALCEIEKQKIIKIEAELEGMRQYRIAVEAIGEAWNVAGANVDVWSIPQK